MFNRSGRTCIANYVKSGSEINAALRGANKGQDIHEQEIKGRYAAEIKCLDELAKPINQLLKTSDDYIILYRTAHAQYDENESSGYISAADRFLPGFGSEKWIIYVPVNIPVLVADISSAVKEVGKSAIQTYEIILPRNTILHEVAATEKATYYIVSSGNLELNERLTRKILLDAAK